ncbi:unnamed protein product [Cylicocyclus nassatus]|uniref:Phospholipase A2-like central domain-containing protein n=1 Tax=Cylicocyclus nassatus TaxID=53992 RepID=A0AA36M8J3_CYLNA|nr:unnamed protein product [Cylicocyclus nassatus]
MATLQFLLRHGCYCGFGNHGNVMPEDGYDDCCRKHDDCYDKLVKEGACSCTLGQYLLPYWFRCNKCQAKCYCKCNIQKEIIFYLKKIPSQFTLPFPFKYIGWYKRCALELCECDRKMMECWRREQWLYESGAPPDKKTCRKTTNALTPQITVSKERSWWERQFERILYPNKKEVNEENTNRIDESEMDKPGLKCKKYAVGTVADVKGTEISNEIH